MVTAAKPKVGGAIYVAPANSTLPTAADDTLDAAFKSLGYVSDEGLTRAVDLDTDVVKAWGGDTVYVMDNGKTETFQFSMLDATSADVLKVIYGDSNVTGTALATGISIVSNNTEKGSHCYVVDMIEKDNTLHRIVIPNGIVSDLDDITYVDNEVLAYGVTITAIADATGNTVYEYLKTS